MTFAPPPAFLSAADHGLDPAKTDATNTTALNEAIDAAQAHVKGVVTTPDPHTAGAPFPEVNRPLWLEAGLSLINTKEAPGSADNPIIIEWAQELGGEIAKDYTHDSIPWCALFANHCLAKVGIPGTNSLWALDFAGNWPSIRLIGPAVGAFAPMTRSGGGHIIQVVGKDTRGNIMGLGGNQSDAVNIRAFPLARLNKGFWWPKSVPAPKQVGLSQLPVVNMAGKLSTKES